MTSIPKNLTVSILISVAAFVFWALVLPSYNSLAILKSTIKDRAALLASRQEILNKVSSLVAEYQKRTDDLQRISMIVPEKVNTAELITALDDITSKSGLQLESLTLNVEKSNAGTSVNSSTVPYNMVNIETSLKGDYGQMFTFLSNIEKSLRLIDTSILDINAPQDVKGVSILEFSIKSNTYFLKSTEEIAKANAQNQINQNAQSKTNNQ